jgi:Holliday junction resolvasome RuvABC ATP-dependent DNA helicase subunit
MTKLYFDGIIGQEENLSQLSFFIDAYKSTKTFPHTLITGTRGFGKTMLARSIGKNLITQDNKPRKFVEINAAEFSTSGVGTFVNDVVIPHINNQLVTLYIDETHLLSPAILNWLLSVFNPTDNGITQANYNNLIFDFNTNQFTCITSTTNPEVLSKPFIERFERIDLKQYSLNDLIKILHKNGPAIQYLDNVERSIVKCLRNSPRMVTKFLKNKIKPYLKLYDKEIFDSNDWESLKQKVNVKPFGLQSNEIEILKFLSKRGDSTLTAISSYLSLDSSTVRRDYEAYLLAMNLITIDGKRILTNKGKEVLKQIKE